MIVFILIIVGIVFLVSTVFIITHLRPLNQEEIKSLADKRRNNQVRNYYTFDNRELLANKEFKKQMNSSGKFYDVNETLFSFPSRAAALLKYKKHEWIIIGFESNKSIDLVWLNKGFDRASASLHLSYAEITHIAKLKNHTSVLMFHNHPNSNPNYHDCRKPSHLDLGQAKEFMQVLKSEGINLLEFICERGKHYEYFLSVTDTFFPLINYINAIFKENDQSKIGNLSLHFEMLF